MMVQLTANPALQEVAEDASARSHRVRDAPRRRGRDLEVEGQAYEAIPEDLIVKAGFIAASRLVGPEAGYIHRSVLLDGMRLPLTAEG